VTSPPPNGPKIDRVALDRIIQRATELQTGEREVGDNLTPDDVLALGKEVGIPARYLQQAMLEHQTMAATAPDSSVLGRLIGPGEIATQRVVQGDVADVIQALVTWMDKNELMVIQRQQPGWVSWETLKGMQAAIRRGAASLDTTKPKFMLSRTELVVATVTQLESGYSHVTLTATLRETRREFVIGSAVAATLGAGATATLVTLGALSAVAMVPIGVGLLVSASLLRRFRPISDRVRLGLERALDFLERGGVKAVKEMPTRGTGLFDLLASEVRRALTGPSESRRQSGARPTPRDETK